MKRELQKLIREDFDRLLDRERLNTTSEIERLVLLQSIEGHAHNGHGAFRQRRFVDVTTSDVVRALGFDASEVKTKRQRLIDAIFRWAELAEREKQPDSLVDGDGKPLLGVPQFADIIVKGQDLLKGFYVGGLRDNVEVRAQVEEKHGVPIGGGSCYLVDTEVMRRMGFDGESLAHEAHDEEIERFRTERLIVEVPDSEVDDDRIRYMYIRHREGNGHSDDAAVVAAGALYGRDVALGVFLADAIDTLDKYARYYRDQDYEIGIKAKSSRFFNESWDESLETVTYLAAIPDENDDVPDSSLRYFLLVDRETERCALLSHLDFIEGRPTVPLLLGHSRVKNTVFYKYMRSVLSEYAAYKPEPAVTEIPLGSVASAVNRNFVTVRETEQLSSVIKTFLEKGAELAVVVDDDGEVRGTLDARDLLRIIWSRDEND
ncbi:MAG: CBS domain-containing protein [Candidatus Coatesbacteria bacterium]|nr:MAG: CBS domain-containing protein [Candidatus Coatesbacteria bacterium]